MKHLQRPASGAELLRRLFSMVILTSLMALSGCAGVPGQGPWDSRVNLTPGWNTLGQAAVKSLKDPLTWGPAAGSAIFSLGKMDQEVSDWARDEQPLFGRHAGQVSDGMLSGIYGLYLGTAVVADSGEGQEWQRNKIRGLGLGLGANLTTAGLSYGIKGTIRRTRPDGSDRKSFPSGHSSLAATNAALFARNLEALPLARSTRQTLRVTGYALALGTAWARVEAGKHYPSDTLAGMALGNWIALTLLTSMSPDSHLRVALQLDQDHTGVVLHFPFGCDLAR